MKITQLRIQNFRSIRSLDIYLGDSTVFIGPNNAGKSAILEAIRIILTRRWGQRGTGFTEHDVHRPGEEGDPKTLPPVTVEMIMEEPAVGAWDADMVAALEDIVGLLRDGRNKIGLRVTCAWSEEKEAFEPAWQFLNPAGEPLPEKKRAINLSNFFDYMKLFWLGPLRDSADEFTPRAGHWGRLLKGIRIPDDIQADVLRKLEEIDAQVCAADPRLSQIAEKIGEATQVAIGDGPGGARLNTMPMAMEDMLARTGVVIRNEDLRPWLPLDHHGSGLQSLAVIFLFQAAALQQIAESLEERPGMAAVFAIEEPEAHLHPQAARSLWSRVQGLSGQRIVTTHSPYFVQHVPLHDLRLVRLRNGCTEVMSIPPKIVSDLPWNASVDGIVRGGAGRIFSKDPDTGCVVAQHWFDETLGDQLTNCYRRDAEPEAKAASVAALRYNCRTLPSKEDEEELGFHGRRVRGEIFFARRWIMVEGVTEHLLLHALGKALGWCLDDHGVAVIDFQQSGSAGIYPALADAFQIPWQMIHDGDGEGTKFRKQLLDRGFTEESLRSTVFSLPPPNDLEDQLIADGHEALLRQILSERAGRSALTCPLDEFTARLKNKKTLYMNILALRVASDPELAEKMPAPFVQLIKNLRDGVL